MITLTTIQEILAETFFSNDMMVAGLMMYAVLLGILFAVVRNLTAVMIIAIPITLMFASMGILQGDLLIVMIIIVVIGVALTAGRTLAGRD